MTNRTPTGGDECHIRDALIAYGHALHWALDVIGMAESHPARLALERAMTEAEAIRVRGDAARGRKAAAPADDEFAGGIE